MSEPSGVSTPLHGRAKAIQAGLTAVLSLTVLITPTTGHTAVPGANGKIAFVSVRDGNREIYVMNADGSEQTNLTNHPAEDDDPAWSPDGTRIAFASNRGGSLDIYVMNPDGTGVTQVTNDAGGNTNPHWSPTGTRIVFTSRKDGHPHIYVMNSDGSAVTRLTSGDASDVNPRWSPDGTKVAFSSDRANDGHWAIYIMNADGGDLTRHTFNAGDNYHPDWSVDGTKLLFRSGSATAGDVSVVNAYGNDVITLSGGAADDTTPVWSPDGTTVLFSSNRGGQYGICLMNADGSGAGCLTDTGDVNPDWSVRPANQPIRPVISWVNPSPIVYGTPLGPAQLNATTTVAGMFLYTPPAGTILALGSAQTLSATFTPADTVAYANATAYVTIDVVNGTVSPLGMFTGRVAATSGLALAGIDEWVYDVNGALVATARTATDGHYASPLLSPGTYYVRTFNDQAYRDAWFDAVLCSANCSAEGARAVTVAAGSTIAGIDFVLEQAGGIAGRVTDAVTGIPVAGVGLDILDDAGRLISKSWTRADGAYGSTGLLPGSYRARTSNTLGYLDKLYDGIACAGLNCDPRAGASIVITDTTRSNGIDFALYRGGRIAGAVHHSGSGNPIANVTIQILTATGGFVTSASTNAEGGYETAALPAGTYLARTLNAIGLKDALYPAVDCGPICEVTRGMPIVVTVGTTTTGVNFDLAAAGGVTGRVRTASTGAPLSGISIQLYDSTGLLLTSTVTHSSGAYSLRGLSTGTYFVRTGNALGYQDRVYNDVPCQGGDCTVLAGNPIAVVEGVTATGIDFVLENRPASVLTVTRSSAVHGGTMNLAATLIAANAPIVGRAVSFVVNGSLMGTAITDAAGLATISGVAVAALDVRTYSNGIQASFAGDASYQPISATADFTVAKRVPVVTWIAPAAIVRGTPLGAAQLNATADVPGTFVYRPQGGTVLPVGTGQALRVTFFPDDVMNCATPINAAVTIAVDSASAPLQPTYQVLHDFKGTDGASPQAGLFQGRDGFLYGTTFGSGSNGAGTIYRLDTAGRVTVLHQFAPGDGGTPHASPVEAADGNFYGTTSSGGVNGAGTIYRMNASGTLTTLHAFQWSDGARPNAGLVRGTDGLFYATTFNAGQSSSGTVVRIDASGRVTLMHAFNGTEGAFPAANVIQGSDGNFYGTTLYGGPNGVGTIYRMDSSGTVTILHGLSRAEGAYPYAGLLEGSDGFFYGTTLSGGAGGGGVVYRIDAEGSITILHAFTSGEGISPYAALIQGNDGYFYGTTSGGGPGGGGSVYRMDASGRVAVLHAFSGLEGAAPYAGLIQARDEFLYGTTSSGGAQGVGTVFRVTTTPGNAAAQLAVSPASATFGGASTLTATLTSSSVPLSGEAVNFSIGGRTVATAVSDASGIAAAANVRLTGIHPGTVSIQASFAGDAWHLATQGSADLIVAAATPKLTWPAPPDIHVGVPLGTQQLNAVADVPGTFTYDPPQGTVLRAGSAQALTAVFIPSSAIDYRIATATASINVLKAQPTIVWAAPADVPFGTPLGNAQLNAVSNVPGTFLYSPELGTPLTLGSGQVLTATFTPLDIVTYATVTATVRINVVRAAPAIAWAAPQAIAYGTSLGSAQLSATANVAGTFTYKPGIGTVLPVGHGQSLSVTFFPTDAVGYAPATRSVTIDVVSTTPPPQPTYQVLHNFTRADGANPQSGLIQAHDGTLYGTTSSGGPNDFGTVFRLGPNGPVNVIRALTTADGTSPVAGLLEGSDGNLYGMGFSGGPNGAGTVYRVDATSTVTMLHAFTWSDGSHPNAALIQARDGRFYGTVFNGGRAGAGTVVRVNPSGEVTLLGQFTGVDAGSPAASLIQGTDGNFYGTTFYGGQSGVGTVFRMDPNGAVTVLHAFARTDGAYPYAGLLQGSDGNFYGTTSSGGPGGRGTVFRMSADGGFAMLHGFTSNEGTSPYAALIQGRDGFFYGTTTQGGRNALGSVYRIDASGSVSVLHAFTGADGASSRAGLVEAADGFFYGTTSSGGAQGVGTVFRLTLVAGTTEAQLLVAAASGSFGGTTTLSATLSSSTQPLSGETVSFAFNGRAVATAITDSSGLASATSVSLAGLHGGTATIQGTFAGDALHAGAAGSAGLTVLPLTPRVVWETPADTRYGTALGSLQLRAVADVPGTFVYDPPAGTILRAGDAQVLSAVFTPAAVPDQSVVPATVLINVLKASPTIVWNSPNVIAAETPLGNGQLNASSNVSGTFEYTPGAGTVLPVGSGHALAAVFTPTDTENFTSETAMASIDVMVPEEIDEAEQLTWQQTAAPDDDFGPMQFAIYVDGTRVGLPGVSCTAVPDVSDLVCSTSLSLVPLGVHTLELSSFRLHESTVTESSRSAPLLIRKVAQ